MKRDHLRLLYGIKSHIVLIHILILHHCHLGLEHLHLGLRHGGLVCVGWLLWLAEILLLLHATHHRLRLIESKWVHIIRSLHELTNQIN